jgi:hypothetical protein
MTIEWDGDWSPPRDDDRGVAAVSGASGGTVFEGPVEFAQALYRALETAVGSSTLRLCWCDPDFAAWPLGEDDWIALLTRWARPGGRELVMIASTWQQVERLHPRFATWRRDWAHVIRCMDPDDGRTAELPTLWIDSSNQVLRVFDREHWRGRAGFDRVDRQCAREDFDAISQRATPGFSAVTLGL